MNDVGTRQKALDAPPPATTSSVLLVEDHRSLQRMLSRALADRGYRVVAAASGEEALARIGECAFDVIVADVVMPGLGGLDLLDQVRALAPRAAVILMTGYATLDSAVAALRGGAADYLEKPFEPDDLAARIERALRRRDGGGRERPLAPPARPAQGSHWLVGVSRAMRAVREQIARIARTANTVLITGESGVGKELAARAIHAAGAGHDRPLVAVNCAARPEALLESQLFGHARGAVTTAPQTSRGAFAAASGGTLLLDEVGELPLALQMKLLRAIEERAVVPVGGTRSAPLDARIIACASRDLAREVEAGRFRAGLFYRLDVLHLRIPPLRERPDDIPELAAHLVGRLNARLGTRFAGVEREAMQALMRLPWKGNVRELENALERAMTLGSGPLITLDDLPGARPADAERAELREAIRRFERQYVLEVLAETDRDKRKAADRLGISLASLYRKLSLGGARPRR
jgi:DNA-binding NtrC family response regulator